MTQERPLVYLPPEARGLTEEADQMRGFLDTSKSEWKHFTPEFVGTKVQELDFDETVKLIDSATERYKESRISQPEGLVKFATNLPVAIVHIGDLHIGSIYTDHKEVFRKLALIKEIPNVYVIFMSNLIDNGIPTQFPDNMLVNAIPPDKQVIIMRQLAMELNEKGKVLAAITSPCHEGWTFKKTGQDINALIFGFPERKFPVLENGGRLTLEFAGAKYLGGLYHQVGPFESNFNETHALRQLNRLNFKMEADWMAGAHRHSSAAQEVYEGTGKHRKLVAYLRTGTEKGTGEIYDQFTIGRYGRTGNPTGQTIELWPNERRIVATCEFDTALLAHEAHYLRAMAKLPASPEKTS